MKTLINSGIALALLAATAAAQAQDARKPDEVIRSATEEARADIRENIETYRSDKGAFYAMIDRVVVPYFDVPYISQLVLARSYRSATPAQRERFTEAFQSMVVRSYADVLLEYYDEVEIEWAPLRMAEDADNASVSARILRRQGQPIPVDFRMHKTEDGSWKIWDVTVEGISVVGNFRAQFAQEIKTNGLDSLIDKLENLQIEAPAIDDEAGDGNG